MTVTIQLTPQDTLPSTLARLEAAPDERVLFVVPADLALSLVDLRVLRRVAASHRRGLALVTTNAELRQRAAQVGISTFRNQRRGERARWRRMRAFAPATGRPVGPSVAEAPPGPGLFAKRSPSGFRPVVFLRSFVRRQSPWWTDLALIVLLLALLGGLVAALATVIPAAQITVVPASEPIKVTVPLRAIQDAAADSEAGILPAHAISTQVAGEAKMETSGRRKEPSAKASGVVLFVNRLNRPLTVSAGTLVATATGDNVQFATKAQVQLDPNGRASVPVEAVLPGPTGNVRAGTITQVASSMASGLIVTNEAPTAGGDAAEVGVVTEDDQAKLQTRLFEELKQKALDQLREKLDPEMFLADASVTFLALSPTFTPFVGDVSPDVSLSMSVQAVGLAVDTPAGEKVALARLQAAMPPGSRLIGGTLRYIPGAIVVKSANTIEFDMTAEGTLLRGVDTGAVRTAVKGLRPDEAAETLQGRFSLARVPAITLGPDWLPMVVPTHLPVLPWRTRVDVDWDAAVDLAARQ